MSLRRPNSLISDDDGLSYQDWIRIGFIVIGAVVTMLLTDSSGLFFGAIGGYMAFEALVSILTFLSPFFNRRQR